MDISGISSQQPVQTTVSQVASQKTGDATGLAAADKVTEVNVNAEEEIVRTVPNPPQDVPGEQLSSHLGRNIDVTV